MELVKAMTSQTAAVPSHVSIGVDGVARIAGTRIKVLDVAAERRFGNVSPEKMRELWPHLSLAQIHSALAYYYDNQAEIDAELAEEAAEFEKAREAQARDHSPALERIRHLKSRDDGAGR
jgi:uncharacterized protein (DUF433 family)